MKTYSYPDVKTVIICGDIHGNFEGIVHKLCVQFGCTDTLLIVAGDCGFGFEKPGYYEQIYGHFHRSWCGEREHILFTMLDIEEFKEIL